jgi:hypothetical protein
MYSCQSPFYSQAFSSFTVLLSFSIISPTSIFIIFPFFPVPPFTSFSFSLFPSFIVIIGLFFKPIHVPFSAVLLFLFSLSALLIFFISTLFISFLFLFSPFTLFIWPISSFFHLFIWSFSQEHRLSFQCLNLIQLAVILMYPSFSFVHFMTLS